MTGRKRERLFVLNDPHALRINAALAMEIGLNESILLLQIEFLLSISDNVHEGTVWTYQSLTDLREAYFPFWGKSTIGRAMQGLVERELLLVGNFNRAGFDRTQWYALNPVGISRLASVRLETPSSQFGTWSSQPGTTMSQNETSTSQDGTTIPETTSETTSEENVREFRNSKEPNREQFLQAFDGTRFDPKRRREGAD